MPDVSMYWEHDGVAELLVDHVRLSGSPDDVRYVMGVITSLQDRLRSARGAMLRAGQLLDNAGVELGSFTDTEET